MLNSFLFARKLLSGNEHSGRMKEVSSRYKDLSIRIIGSLIFAYLIDAMGRTESFFQRITTSFFYIDLLGGFVMTMIVWETIRRVVLFLDAHYNWLEQTATRVVIQILLGVGLPMLLSFLLTFGYMKLWNQNIFETEWLLNEFFFVFVGVVLINLFYFTYWLYLYKTETTQKEMNLPSVEDQESITIEPKIAHTKTTVVEVNRGEKVLLLQASTIAYAFLQNGYCYIRTFDGDQFVTTYSLDDLYELLTAADFFRINRQFIANRNACVAYSSIENGKIAIELTPAAKEPVIVSQKKAKSFREWILAKANANTNAYE